jgi:hypothetical protein
MIDAIYVIERSRNRMAEVEFWTSEGWTTDLKYALRIGGYNVAVPIAGILQMMSNDGWVIQPKHAAEASLAVPEEENAALAIRR